MEEIEVELPSNFIEACIHFAACQKFSCLLLSNNISSACNYNTYELLFAYSNSDIQRLNANANDFKGLGELLSKEKSGWLFGHFGYDLKNSIEDLKSENYDFIGFTDMFFFEPQCVISIPFGNNKVRIQAANPEVELRNILEAITGEPTPKLPLQVQQHVSKVEYIRNVERIKNHIYEGDFYELNYCIPFSANGKINPAELFLQLNAMSPMPFASFYKMGSHFLLCASPERFLKKLGDKVIAQPIKGTRPRSIDPDEDSSNKLELGTDEKERAENVMIVDLIRNDLSKTSQTGRVKVEEIFGVYSFKRVHQMISTITSFPYKNSNLVDIIKSAFPMGSMTGAPKIEVMKAIEKFENTKRGLFSGSVGYFNPEGDFDFNVVIRSILYNSTTDQIQFQVGSAITSDSIPELEYEECLIKASSILKVLQNEI